MSQIEIFKDKEIYEDGIIFKAKGKTWLNRKWRYRPTFIFPNVPQSGPESVLFKKKVKNRCEQLKISDQFLDKEKLDILLTDMDMPSSLAPGCLEDNRQWRERIGCRKPTEDDLQLFRELVKLIIDNSELQPIVHKNESSSGAPNFIVGSAYKKTLLRRTYGKGGYERFKQIVDYCSSNNIESLNKLGICNIFTQGERKHPTRANKERIFFNPEKLKEGVFEEEKVDFKHPVYEELHCYDRRSMYAMNYELNVANQILNNALFAGFKKVCSAINYKGEKELSKTIKSLPGERKLFSLDKMKFGETFCNELLHVFFEELTNSKFKDLAIIALYTAGAPTIFRELRRGHPELIQIGSDMAEFSYQSFKSGDGLVAFFGKLLGTFDAVLMIRDLLGKKIFVLTMALNNQFSKFVWFCNSGDDTIFSIVIMLYPKFSTNASLHKDVIEDEVLFLGFYYFQNGDVYTKLNRFVESLLLNERDISFKSFPALGTVCKLELAREYSQGADEALFIVAEELKKTFRFDLNVWLSEGDIVTGSMTIQDKYFLSNPDIIHYKLDPSLVTPELLAKFYHTTDVEEFHEGVLV